MDYASSLLYNGVCEGDSNLVLTTWECVVGRCRCTIIQFDLVCIFTDEVQLTGASRQRYRPRPAGVVDRARIIGSHHCTASVAPFNKHVELMTRSEGKQLIIGGIDFMHAIDAKLNVVGYLTRLEEVNIHRAEWDCQSRGYCEQHPFGPVRYGVIEWVCRPKAEIIDAKSGVYRFGMPHF